MAPPADPQQKIRYEPAAIRADCQHPTIKNVALLLSFSDAPNPIQNFKAGPSSNFVQRSDQNSALFFTELPAQSVFTRVFSRIFT
jgi:hypothetical protein